MQAQGCSIKFIILIPCKSQRPNRGSQTIKSLAVFGCIKSYQTLIKSHCSVMNLPRCFWPPGLAALRLKSHRSLSKYIKNRFQGRHVYFQSTELAVHFSIFPFSIPTKENSYGLRDKPKSSNFMKRFKLGQQIIKQSPAFINSFLFRSLGIISSFDLDVRHLFFFLFNILALHNIFIIKHDRHLFSIVAMAMLRVFMNQAPELIFPFLTLQAPT